VPVHSLKPTSATSFGFTNGPPLSSTGPAKGDSFCSSALSSASSSVERPVIVAGADLAGVPQAAAVIVTHQQGAEADAAAAGLGIATITSSWPLTHLNLSQARERVEAYIADRSLAMTALPLFAAHLFIVRYALALDVSRKSQRVFKVQRTGK